MKAVAKANQTFFIPESIRRLRLSSLPHSLELASVLRKMRVSTLNDLSGASLREFQRVSVNGAALFLEMRRLIERARRGDFPVPPLRNARLNFVSSRRRPPLDSDAEEKRQTQDRAISEPTADEMIFIPMEARGKLLATFPVSVRLQNIFGFKRFRLIGDLHGRSFSEIRGYRNCGKKTIEELRDLVRTIQHSHQTSVADGKADVVVHEAPPSVAAGAILVPAKLRELNVADLPLSVRLERVLERKGVRRLGDIHGACISDLRGMNCGSKTISELARLIARAAAGEFSPAGDVAWDPAELVRTRSACYRFAGQK